MFLVRNNPFAALVQNDRLILITRALPPVAASFAALVPLAARVLSGTALLAENFSELIGVVLQHLDLFRRQVCNLFIRKLITSIAFSSNCLTQ